MVTKSTIEPFADPLPGVRENEQISPKTSYSLVVYISDRADMRDSGPWSIMWTFFSVHYVHSLFYISHIYRIIFEKKPQYPNLTTFLVITPDLIVTTDWLLFNWKINLILLALKIISGSSFFQLIWQ